MDGLVKLHQNREAGDSGDWEDVPETNSGTGMTPRVPELDRLWPPWRTHSAATRPYPLPIHYPCLIHISLRLCLLFCVLQLQAFLSTHPLTLPSVRYESSKQASYRDRCHEAVDV